VVPQSKVDYIPVTSGQSLTAGGRARNSAASTTPKGFLAAAGMALLLALLL
jgi:hypothetical protein